ncbi:MAG: GNAT family N-acetyltransferase [Candidatus Gracilibacteria bacterium]|nr:GNAT family N-acetyltransferase [Candidatus Gracilibacteria bacterium]
MIIREGKIEDFPLLEWAWKDDRVVQQKYISAIQDGKQSFLVVEADEKIIGEIHLWWVSDNDLEVANEKNRAYLSTFRIHDDHQRKGYGKQLMMAALDLIKKKGYTQVTIASYEGEDEIEELYKKWGFSEVLRDIVVTDKGGAHSCRLHLKRLE